jgi:hypothetical protein
MVIYRERTELYGEAWKIDPNYIVRHKHILARTKEELVVSPTGQGLVSPTRDATELDLQKLIILIFTVDYIKINRYL